MKKKEAEKLLTKDHALELDRHRTVHEKIVNDKTKEIDDLKEIVDDLQIKHTQEMLDLLKQNDDRLESLIEKVQGGRDTTGYWKTLSRTDYEEKNSGLGGSFDRFNEFLTAKDQITHWIIDPFLKQFMAAILEQFIKLTFPKFAHHMSGPISELLPDPGWEEWREKLSALITTHVVPLFEFAQKNTESVKIIGDDAENLKALKERQNKLLKEQWPTRSKFFSIPYDTQFFNSYVANDASSESRIEQEKKREEELAHRFTIGDKWTQGDRVYLQKRKEQFEYGVTEFLSLYNGCSVVVAGALWSIAWMVFHYQFPMINYQADRYWRTEAHAGPRQLRRHNRMRWMIGVASVSFVASFRYLLDTYLKSEKEQTVHYTGVGHVSGLSYSRSQGPMLDVTKGGPTNIYNNNMIWIHNDVVSFLQYSTSHSNVPLNSKQSNALDRGRYKSLSDGTRFPTMTSTYTRVTDKENFFEGIWVSQIYRVKFHEDGSWQSTKPIVPLKPNTVYFVLMGDRKSVRYPAGKYACIPFHDNIWDSARTIYLNTGTDYYYLAEILTLRLNTTYIRPSWPAGRGYNNANPMMPTQLGGDIKQWVWLANQKDSNRSQIYARTKERRIDTRYPIEFLDDGTGKYKLLNHFPDDGNGTYTEYPTQDSHEENEQSLEQLWGIPKELAKHKTMYRINVASQFLNRQGSLTNVYDLLYPGDRNPQDILRYQDYFLMLFKGVYDCDVFDFRLKYKEWFGEGNYPSKQNYLEFRKQWSEMARNKNCS